MIGEEQDIATQEPEEDWSKYAVKKTAVKADDEWSKYVVPKSEIATANFDQKNVESDDKLSGITETRQKFLDNLKPKVDKILSTDFFQDPQNRQNFFDKISSRYNDDEIKFLKTGEKPYKISNDITWSGGATAEKQPSESRIFNPDITGDKMNKKVDDSAFWEGKGLMALANPAGTISTAIKNGVEGGYNQLKNTGNVYDNEGELSATANAVAGVSKMAFGLANIIPGMAAFTVGTEAVSGAVPQAKHAFTIPEDIAKKVFDFEPTSEGGKAVMEMANMLVTGGLLHELGKGYDYVKDKQAVSKAVANGLAEFSQLPEEQQKQMVTDYVTKRMPDIQTLGAKGENPVFKPNEVQQKQFDSVKDLNKKLSRTETPEHFDELKKVNPNTPINEIPDGTTATFNGKDGIIQKSETGEIIHRAFDGSESIVTGGGDTTPNSQHLQLNEGHFKDKHGDYFVEKTQDGYTVYRVADGGKLTPAYEGDTPNVERRNAIISKALNKLPVEVAHDEANIKVQKLSEDIAKNPNGVTTPFLREQLKKAQDDATALTDATTSAHVEKTNAEVVRDKAVEEMNGMSAEGKEALKPVIEQLNGKAEPQIAIPDEQPIPQPETPAEPQPSEQSVEPIKSESNVKEKNEAKKRQELLTPDVSEGNKTIEPVSEKSLTEEKANGLEEAKSIAKDNGFDSATHLLNSVKSAGLGEFKTVQEAIKNPEVLKHIEDRKFEKTDFTEEEIQNAYYEREQELKKAPDYKSQLIHDNLGRIKRSDFEHYADKKMLDKSNISRMNILHFSDKATPLDVQMHDMSEAFGIELTPQDAVDYILDRERNPDKYLKQKVQSLNKAKQIPLDKAKVIAENPELLTVQDVEDLRGFPLTDEEANILVEHIKNKTNENSTEKGTGESVSKPAKISKTGKENAAEKVEPQLAAEPKTEPSTPTPVKESESKPEKSAEPSPPKAEKAADKNQAIKDKIDKANELKEKIATGKKLADKIRSVADKIEMKFYDENGNEIKPTKSGGGLSEKEILYKIADLVEKGGELIDHIKAVLSEQDWYKNLSAKGKEAVEKQIETVFEKDKKDIGIAARLHAEHESLKGLSAEDHIKRGQELIKDDKYSQENIRNRYEENKDSATSKDLDAARAHYEEMIKKADILTDEGKTKEAEKISEEAAKWKKDIIDPIGLHFSELGRGFQGQTDINTGSFTTLVRTKEEATGKKLTEGEKKTAEKLSSDVKKTRKEESDATKKLAQQVTEPLKESPKTRAARVAEANKKIADGIDALFSKIPSIKKNLLPEEKTKALDDIKQIISGIVEKGDIALEDAIKFAKDYIDKKYPNTFNKTDIDSKFSAEREIAQLEKSIADLEQGKVRYGGVKTKSTPTEEQAKTIKELKDRKEELKKQLGLIPSKDLPEPPPIAELKTDLQKLIESQQEFTNNIEKEEAKIQPDEEKIKELERKKELTKGQISDLSEKIKKSTEQKYRELVESLAGKTDNKFTPDQVKGIWQYAKDAYIDKDVQFDDMVHNVADDLGLTPEQVRRALAEPKGAKEQINSVYRKQIARNRAEQKAKAWVEQQTENPLTKAAKAVSQWKSALLLAWHGGSIPLVTHGGINFWDYKTYPIILKGMKDSFRFTLSEAYHKAAINDYERTDKWLQAKRYGVKNEFGKIQDDYQNIPDAMKKIVEPGSRAFDFLKIARTEWFDSMWNSLKPEERTEAMGKIIAQLSNTAWGTVSEPVGNVGGALFAPSLEGSRWQRLLNPVKAVGSYAKDIAAIKWKEYAPTTEEKVFRRLVLRRTGRIVATLSASLLANQALLKLSGSSQNINLTDPTKPDFLKYKFGGRTVDISGGMISTVNLIGKLTQELVEAEKGRTDINTQHDLLNYARHKLNPILGTVVDFAYRHDMMGNTLPTSDNKAWGKHATKLTWAQYIEQNQLPIPIADAFRDLAESMKESGMDEKQTQKILWAIATGTITGTTGIKVTHDYPDDKTLTIEDTYTPAEKAKIEAAQAREDEKKSLPENKKKEEEGTQTEQKIFRIMKKGVDGEEVTKEERDFMNSRLKPNQYYDKLWRVHTRK